MDNKKKYIRKGQEVTFSAKLKKGDGSLTSWIVYEGNQYDDDHIVKEEKQAGTEFTFTFEKVGEYTIISYGKREEIKKKTKCIDNKSSISSKTNNEGKEEILVNELDSNCAFRLEVIENTIVSIDCVENKIRNAVRRSTDNWELKKGTSVTFKANFYIEKPTEEELSSLKMFVLDSNKNILVAQEGNNISFIPENDNGTYTISAEHITSSGDKVTKEIIGKCILNNVISIKPDKPGELFRPNEEIIFKVDRMKFSADLEDTSRIKWYLNTILKQEGGETFKFSSDKKGVYFVEATNLEPNSSAKPDEKDTWKLTITDNEVKSISIKGMPKVGRPFELKAKTTFPDLTLEEMQKIKWYIPFNYKEKLGGSNINPRNKTPHFHNTQRIKDPRTIKITPSGAGTFKVSCRINSEFVEENIEIVQPKISSPHWIDKDGSSGNILEKAGYYQEMYAYAKHIGLDEEEVILEVYDVTNKQKPIYTSEKVVVPKGSKEICIPYTIKKTYKGKTEEEKKKEDLERKDIQIFFKIKAADTNFLIVSPNKEFENNLLTITNRGNVVEAYFCDKKDFNKVPIAVCGYRLYFKIYATNLLKREVEVHFCTKEAIKDDFSNSFVWRNWKELEEKFNKEYFFDVKKGVINERGELLVEVDTTKLKKFAPISAIAIIKIINKDGNELGAYKDLDDTLKLYNDSVLERLPQNFSSVKVGYFEIKEVKRVALEEKKCVCEEKVRAFMRMLRVKEGTEGEKGYTTLYGGTQFSDMSKHPNKVITLGKYSSTAAGAYQIMGYTYDGIKKYFSKYNITNFNQEAQDKMCLIILKNNYLKDRNDSFYNPVFYKDKDKKDRDTLKENKAKEWRKRFKGKQGDIIQFIIDDDLERATLLSSLCWSSLPDSPYGQQSSKYTFEDVKRIYENFLKEEIEGKTDLHLKKGFLKEFGYNCGCDKKLSNSNIQGKGWNIDVHLWEDRKEMGYGILVLKDSAENEVWRTIVRAQGHTNKIGGSRKIIESDTPIGTYKFEKWRSDGNSVIYGENPRLDMTYESGEAKGIREEIQIHGGRQKGDKNPYLWNTGGCLRVFDDAIVTLKSKIVELEKGKEVSHYINISHSLKFDEVSQKYFIPSDYEELKLSPNNQEILKKGIVNKRYYRNEKNYYTDNINA